ncbi:Disease resistance RPP13-like protein 4 [Bienertia sinuspersici]
MLQLQSTNAEPDFDSADVLSEGENLPEPLAVEFAELVKIIKSCWISHPESTLPHCSDVTLSDEQLQQLLCFSLLDDEAAVLTKKQLTYWWVGQGLINADDGNDIDFAVDAILSSLLEAGAIERVSNYTKQTLTNKYRRIIKLQSMQQNMVGVLRKGEITDEKSSGNIETLFNYNVSTLNMTPDKVRQMRNLKVLHLGSWSRDRKHIEVEKIEILKALKYLKKLTFISLKGISRIMKLGDEICNVGDSLRVLDLQDCPNLEVLPKRIGNLQNLTHLDVSQCYLLDRIPKSITLLTKLQVLEGFVISDVDTNSTCRFKDLANHLGTTLRKLSLRTRKMSFPVEDDMRALGQFEKLVNLKVVWVRISDTEEGKVLAKTEQEEESLKLKRSFGRTFRREESNLTAGLPEQLQKLHVQDIPQAAVNCLMLRDNYRLQKLKKLCIIGGGVSDLTNQGRVKWEKIESLKLKYLTKLHMSWMHWKASFPEVTHLEMVQCPFLTLFPCDHYGIWKPSQDVSAPRN